MAKEDRLKKRYKNAGKRYLEAESGSDKEKKREEKLDKAYKKLEEYQTENPSVAQKKGFPEIKEKDQGKFTAWVKKNMPGKSTCAAASTIVKNKDKYKPAVVKMANYANNFGCKKSKGKSPAKVAPLVGLAVKAAAAGFGKKMAEKF